jgi:nucleoside-diphosphate-sugar epimerase
LGAIQLVISAPGTELGRVLRREMRNAPRAEPGGSKKVLINLLAEPPNNLLHDGHRWEQYGPARIIGDTRRLLEDRGHRQCDLIIHASYGFLRAMEAGATPGPRLRPIVEAALEAEEMVLADSRPSGVIRLGYLYGPGSSDLKRYRLAFRLGRPYWAGPRKALHDHIHHTDAARALLLAAAIPEKSRVTYATDGHPASFQSFMDFFARQVGNPLPIHLPRVGRAFAHLVVAEEHMQAVEMGVRGAATPQVPGFNPAFPDYRAGLTDVLQGW